MKKARVKLLAAAAPTLALVLLLAAAEGAVRLRLGAPPVERVPDNFAYGYIDPLKPFFTKAGKRGAADAYLAARPGAAATFLMPKPAGVLRIFVVGGSVALPMSDGGLSGRMEWRRALPGRKIELITCGMNGYDSERDLRTVREVLAYQPDMILVMSGNNESIAPPLVKYPRLYLANHALRRSWLWRRAQKIVVGNFQLHGRGAIEVEHDFENNLRAMARAARQARVPLMLATLPSNLRDAPPIARRPAWNDRDFAAGWRAWERGDAAKAAQAWSVFLARRPADSHGAYFLAKALDAQGARAQANRYYRMAGDLDASGGLRCPPARNALIRSVAQEEGAWLVDLEKTFDGLSRSGVPGRDLMLDSCHWYHAYYGVVMVDVLAAAHQVAGLAAAADWDWSWLSAARPRLERPEIKLEQYAANSLRSALAQAAEDGGGELSEFTLSLLENARRLSPDLWRRADSPRALTALFSESPSVLAAGYQERVERAWPRYLAYLSEARRRAKTLDAVERKASGLAARSAP